MKAYKIEDEEFKANRFSKTPVFEIIEIVKDKYHIYRRDAWNQLYDHYSSHILFHARKRAATIYWDESENIAQDLTSTVLEKLVTKIDSYSVKKSIKKPESQFIAFFAWIMTILENEFVNITRKQKDKEELNKEIIYLKEAIKRKEEDGTYDKNISNYDSNIPLESRLNVQLILKKLSSKEVDILLAFMDHGFQDKRTWKLPKEIKNILCNKYKCKPNSIDKIKLRAIEKIKKELNKN